MGRTITHPDKLLFPADGITKGEVADYYQSVAPFILPQICGRPITLERFPNGIDAEGFIQKNVAKGPDWLETINVPKKDGTVNYLIVCDEQPLLWMINQNTITPHVWTSRRPDLAHPDLCIFDLDPLKNEPDVLVAMALAVRDLLAELGIPSWVKTSGSKGYHIAVPLDGSDTHDSVMRFAGLVAVQLVERHRETLTLEFSKADRGGRILVDIGRNSPGATFAAPYALRARAGAPISAPCSWQEIESGYAAPAKFTLNNISTRLQQIGDLWADLPLGAVSLERAIAELKSADKS